MKINKIVTLLFLLVFGYLISSFKEEIILKTDLSNVNSSLANLIFKIDMLSGFLYPFAFFTFFYILFSISSYIVIDKRIKNLNDILMFSMMPNFIFIAINYYYLIEISMSDLELINQNGLSIIPFLSYDTSTLISNYLVYILPPFFVLYYLMFEKKISTLNSFLISILPISIVFITYNFLK
jgi:hypothetical protein